MTDRTTDQLPATTLAPKSPEVILADSRKWIAYTVIGAYLLLVFINIGLPVLLYVTMSDSKPFSFSDLKDLTSAISTVLAGLVGILGFVVGYYFKSVDDKLEVKKAKKVKPEV